MNGNEAPTPVTVLTIDQLSAAAPTGVADALNQLPVFRNSLKPSTAGSSGTGQNDNGGNFLNLRALGPARTLTLLNGRRAVASNLFTGTTDVNLFPQMLISRVDVVTGGASAAYGSDAVAGVANFVLDTNFTGLKGEIQGGISGLHDGECGQQPTLRLHRPLLHHGPQVPILDPRRAQHAATAVRAWCLALCWL